MNVQGKSIAVLGLGASGEAAARLLLHHGAAVSILDSGDPDPLATRASLLREAGARVRTGPDACLDNTAYEFAVISPGIDPAVPLVQAIIARGVPLLAEIEVAFWFCKSPVIAITGTNGKTTTTGLVAAMLESAGFTARPGGNYGTPFSTIVMEPGVPDYVVLEVSSFQLEEIRTFRPNVSVWLNLAPDHLDRYSSVESYRAAKLRIFDYQTAEDTAVVNARDTLPTLPCKRLTFNGLDDGAGFSLSGGTICFHGEAVLEITRTRLRGAHNAENLMAALGVAHALGISFDKAIPGLCDFQAKPHRCEPVGNIDGVQFLNDSKATNLDALEKALIGQTSPVVLIAGGKDKGFGFEPLAKLAAARCKAAVLIGEMKDRIADSWSAGIDCHKAATLEEAVILARGIAQPGDVVLFSPGTSSFDMFKNYEDRGDQFRTLIQTTTRPCPTHQDQP